MQFNKHADLYYNIVTLAVIIGLSALFVVGIVDLFGPIGLADVAISLDPSNLPKYSLKTGIRMVVAMIFSIIFTIIYATIAAKNLRMRTLLIPLLDVFQSVPILGYLTFLVTFFVALYPSNIFSLEMAVIFAIFTSQVWNMTFAMYQSFITIPLELYEVAKIYKFSKWQIFWKIEVPYAIPGQLWNIMISMGGGWFAIVIAEALAVGSKSYIMPGIGSYIALALKNTDIHAILWAIIAMIAVILIISQLIIRPLVSWSYKFRYEFSDSEQSQSSWLIDYMGRSSIAVFLSKKVGRFMDIIINFRLPKYITNHTKPIMFVCEVIAWILIAKLFYYIYQQMQIIFVGNLDIKDVKETFYLGMLTCLRVFMLIVIASLIWVPVGVYIGLRPKLASKVQFLLQFLSSFPANLYFPVFVIIITKYNLNPTIWLCPLMLIGAQYYILFNVIAGTQSIPNELAEASSVFKLKGWLKWKHFILKAIMPHYLSGAITAAGGAWNASIISEIVNWGDTTISMPGLGAYIVNSTNANNSYKIALGIIVMIIYVVTLNKIFWRPIQKRASEKLRINL